MTADATRDTQVIAPEIGAQSREFPGTEQATAEGEHKERPPFRDRNLAALKIGSRSPRVYGKVAEGIMADLVEAAPWLTEFPEELAALTSTEAVVALMRIDLAGRGLRNSDGTERLAFLDRYFRAEAAAAKRRDSLGLSPIGQAVLAERRAAAAALASHVDLEALAAMGRAALEARTPDLVMSVLNHERESYAAQREADAAQWVAARTHDIPALDPEAVTEPIDREGTPHHDE